MKCKFKGFLIIMIVLAFLGCNKSEAQSSNSGTTTASGEKTQDYSSKHIGTLKYVPAGTFQYGRSDEISTITQPFRMSEYEITVGQYIDIMGKHSSPINSEFIIDTNPVMNVTWYEAITFCNKLSIAEGLTPIYNFDDINFKKLKYEDIRDWIFKYNQGKFHIDWTANGYRLPTSMEWIWAARGADTTGSGIFFTPSGHIRKAFAGSDGSNAIGDYVVDSKATYGISPVGSKLPNELGLYDMSGNVSEWNWDADWDDDNMDYELTDYRGSEGDESSCFRSYNSGIPIGYPSSLNAVYSEFYLGFRVVRN